MEPRKINISKFGLEQDQRRRDMKFDNAFSEQKKNLFDSLVNLVVNHKMELQKIPACSHLNTATQWANKRGLRAGEHDFDKDGHPETVVYNKAGQPFIINGYKLKASDYPVRKAYWEAHPTSEDRAGESMKEWVMDMTYNEKIDEEKPWKRTITTTPFGNKLKDWGYRMPTKPKKQISVFSHFCKLIAPYVKTYFENGALTGLLGQSATPNCALILKKIISPITMYRMLYMKIVERWYMFYLRRGSDEYNFNYKQFKEYCKKNPNKFWTFYMENVLADFYEFKDNIVNDDVVARLFAKDGLDWDFNDPDDAIIFFMGKANVDDDEFTDTIQNDGGAADAFIERLQTGSKEDKKQAVKTLEKWKVRARKGTKEFFEKQVQHLMENNGAYERYLAAVERGRNPIDPNPIVAVPASPERSQEEGNARVAPPDEAAPQDDVVEPTEDDF